MAQHDHARHHGHTHGVVDPSIVSTDRGLWAHNFGDAAAAIPLGIAFWLARRPPSRRFPYGLGRVDDFAGLGIILTIVLSAGVVTYAAINRLLHPQPVTHLGAVIVASIIGFLGNEAVAIFRIRVGRQIGSAALVADGHHAHVDGWTSRSVLFDDVSDVRVFHPARCWLSVSLSCWSVGGLVTWVALILPAYWD